MFTVKPAALVLFFGHASLHLLKVLKVRVGDTCFYLFIVSKPPGELEEPPQGN